MPNMKTVENNANVDDFLDLVENTRCRENTKRVVTMMAEVTREVPRMWGNSIIGFGRYSDGSEHQWMHGGLSPRKNALTVYIMPGFKPYGDLLKKLGKHRHSISCLYITRLENVDFKVLTELVNLSVICNEGILRPPRMNCSASEMSRKPSPFLPLFCPLA